MLKLPLSKLGIKPYIRLTQQVDLLKQQLEQQLKEYEPKVPRVRSQEELSEELRMWSENEKFLYQKFNAYEVAQKQKWQKKEEIIFRKEQLKPSKYQRALFRVALLEKTFPCPYFLVKDDRIGSHTGLVQDEIQMRKASFKGDFPGASLLWDNTVEKIYAEEEALDKAEEEARQKRHRDYNEPLKKRFSDFEEVQQKKRIAFQEAQQNANMEATQDLADTVETREKKAEQKRFDLKQKRFDLIQKRLQQIANTGEATKPRRYKKRTVSQITKKLLILLCILSIKRNNYHNRIMSFRQDIFAKRSFFLFKTFSAILTSSLLKVSFLNVKTIVKNSFF